MSPMVVQQNTAGDGHARVSPVSRHPRHSNGRTANDYTRAAVALRSDAGEIWASLARSAESALVQLLDESAGLLSTARQRQCSRRAHSPTRATLPKRALQHRPGHLRNQLAALGCRTNSPSKVSQRAVPLRCLALVASSVVRSRANEMDRL